MKDQLVYGSLSLKKSSFMRIGTRCSPLALAQASEVREHLARVQDVSIDRLPLIPLQTEGDLFIDRSLADWGGKGLFTKALDDALLNHSIDVAVHSAKDLPTSLPSSLHIVGYLPRADVREALITYDPHIQTLEALPQGALFGSASLRRQALIKSKRADLACVLLRGNIGTRIQRVREGRVQATLLALAGLQRLNRLDEIASILSIEDFPPAVGQGAIALVIRAEDEKTRENLTPLLDSSTGWALAAERAFLRCLDGSCRTPIAGHALVSENILKFKGLVLKEDGSETYRVQESGALETADSIGERAAHQILHQIRKNHERLK